jgi:hypothetical protein
MLSSLISSKLYLLIQDFVAAKAAVSVPVFAVHTRIQIFEQIMLLDTIGFRRWCITHRNIGFSDFVHRPNFSKYQ